MSLETKTSEPRAGSRALDAAPEAEGGRGLAARYQEVRALTELLCAPLGPEDCVVQSMPDASPAKWHLAHTTWFFETFVLKPMRAGYRPLHPLYETLFNSYYNAVGQPFVRARRGLLSRPTLEEVLHYRRHVDEHVGDLLSSVDGTSAPALSVILLGLHHEQQHQELIVTDVKHLFSLNPLHPVYRERVADPAVDERDAASTSSWVELAGGEVGVGHEEGAGFAFDNEGPRHRQLLRPFALASGPVTNREYQAFIEDGGYRSPDSWLSAGWDAVQSGGWKAPLYWVKDGGRWWSTTLAGYRPIVDGEPVCHVSYFEADAYARWAGFRLPLEAEWEIAARGLPITGNFLESMRFHPAALDREESRSAGLVRMYGDTWEWTQSPYTAYPGYRTPAGALGEYNGKFMCGQLVLKGGSCATPAGHIRATYRNFFGPGTRWQFSGMRLARDL